MKKLDLLLKIQNYSVHIQDQISFKSTQTAYQVHGVLVVYICREFHGELVCDQTESKNYVSFRLMNYLVPFIQLLRDSSRFSSLN